MPKNLLTQDLGNIYYEFLKNSFIHGTYPPTKAVHPVASHSQAMWEQDYRRVAARSYRLHVALIFDLIFHSLSLCRREQVSLGNNWLS